MVPRCRGKTKINFNTLFTSTLDEMVSVSYTLVPSYVKFDA